MPSDDRTMKEYYAARAREYDRIYQKPERQADLHAISEWLPSKFVGARVLEIACGTGYWTQFIARVTLHIAALDAAPETLEIARGRVPGSNVEFLVGDAYDPPREGSFDAAFCGFWFSHVLRGRQREFLARLNASLRRSARVVMLDNRYVEGSSTPVAAYDADGNAYQDRRLDDGSTHRVLKNFPAEEELRSLVAGLGEDAAFTAWEYYWAFEYLVA